jgi:hypothetical protein
MNAHTFGQHAFGSAYRAHYGTASLGYPSFFATPSQERANPWPRTVNCQAPGSAFGSSAIACRIVPTYSRRHACNLSVAASARPHLMTTPPHPRTTPPLSRRFSGVGCRHNSPKKKEETLRPRTPSRPAPSAPPSPPPPIQDPQPSHERQGTPAPGQAGALHKFRQKRATPYFQKRVTSKTFFIRSPTTTYRSRLAPKIHLFRKKHATSPLIVEGPVFRPGSLTTP